MSLTQVSPPMVLTQDVPFGAPMFIPSEKRKQSVSAPSVPATMDRFMPLVKHQQQQESQPEPHSDPQVQQATTAAPAAPTSAPAQPQTSETKKDDECPEKDSNIVFHNEYIRSNTSEENTITIGGRKSILATVQSKSVARDLYSACPTQSFPVIALSTLGDLVQGKPLYSFGGKSLWTKELEALMLQEIPGLPKVDLIVHSLKDMPTTLPEGCCLGAITEREDPRDAVIMKANTKYVNISDLPAGAVVGTSSIRRSAQLRKNFPHLKFESVRGNVQTRLRKLDDPNSQYSCIILAVAGLSRLGLSDRITSILDVPDMYYAVGQGALGIEIKSNDEKVKSLLAKINHPETYLKCVAERTLMRTLEGGCSVPIGVHTTFIEEDVMKFSGIVVSVDGTTFVEATVTGSVTTMEQAQELGSELAKELIEKGAKAILDSIHLDHIN